MAVYGITYPSVFCGLRRDGCERGVRLLRVHCGDDSARLTLLLYSVDQRRSVVALVGRPEMDGKGELSVEEMVFKKLRACRNKAEFESHCQAAWKRTDASGTSVFSPASGRAWRRAWFGMPRLQLDPAAASPPGDSRGVSLQPLHSTTWGEAWIVSSKIVLLFRFHL